MDRLPLQFLMLVFAGWVNRHQQEMIEYLQEENRIGRNTIKRILIENGLDPVGGRRTTWKAFLRAHWAAIAATDFFTVEVVTWRGLVRYFVLFVIDLKTRRIEVAGISRSPDGRWMNQVARNLTDIASGFLERTR